MSGKRWNIFAYTLEHILARQNKRLRDLQNKAAIHPEIVSRLQQSLEQPKKCPVLSPDDLEEVIRTFRLSESEKYHLYAAVLAAAVEEELANRFHPASDEEKHVHYENARIAADQILPILFDALWGYRNENRGLATFRGED